MPAKKPFRLIKRKDKQFFYARYLLPDGSYTAARSTKERTRRKAEAVAWDYVQSGKISAVAHTTVSKFVDRRENPDTGEFECHFFDWDSEWTLNKRSAGKQISPQQCRKNNAYLENHIIPIVGNIKLQDIDTNTVRAVRNELFKSDYSGSTINKVLGVFKHIIDAADDKHLIRHNARIERAAVRTKGRGVLSPAQVKDLFSEEWSEEDPRPYAASMLAAATGLRLGEVQGLRFSDFTGETITVRGVWSDSTGGYREGTKNGQESRSVPIPESVSEQLQKCIERSPWGDSSDNYIFYSVSRAERPTTDRVLTQGFYKALTRINISEADRQKMNITFHSHRHFFNTLLLESKIPIEKIQQLTGHLSRSMTEHYYHAGELEDVAEAQRKLFTVVKSA